MDLIDVAQLSRKNLNLLVIFDTVVATGSVTEAAERLNLTQSALSHAISRLRDMFDDPLFVRGKAGFTMTARAQQIAVPIRETLLSLEGLLKPSEFDPSTARRAFRVGLSECCTILFAGGALGVALSTAPNTSLSMEVFDFESEKRLTEGSLDVALWPYDTPHNPLRSSALFNDRFVGVIYSTHPLAAKARSGKVTLEDYLAFPHVQTVLYGAKNDSVDNGLEAIGRQRNTVVRGATFAVGFPLLFKSPLITTVSAHVALSALQICPDMIIFELPFEVETLPYRMVWHKRNDKDAGLTWLRGLLSNVVEQVVGDTFIKGRPKKAPDMPRLPRRAAPLSAPPKDRASSPSARN